MTCAGPRDGGAAQREGLQQNAGPTENRQAVCRSEQHDVATRRVGKFRRRFAVERRGKKIARLLRRVMNDHHGTPWAEMAEKELESPCGWDWKEK